MMKEVKMGVYTKGEEAFDFNFYTDISIADKQKFVNSVVNLIVDNDEEQYNFVLRDLIFDFYIIDFFTDVDTTELKESLYFVNDVEQFLEETNIVEIVKANAFPTLFDELNKAVDKSIEYITGIHPNTLSDALANLINTLEKKVREVDLDNMTNMAQKFAGMTDELTPESIMNAYMNSDIYKKNLEEIKDAKKQRSEFAEDMNKAIKEITKENNMD